MSLESDKFWCVALFVKPIQLYQQEKWRKLQHKKFREWIYIYYQFYSCSFYIKFKACNYPLHYNFVKASYYLNNRNIKNSFWIDKKSFGIVRFNKCFFLINDLTFASFSQWQKYGNSSITSFLCIYGYMLKKG